MDFFLAVFNGKPIPEPTETNPKATRYPTFAERRDAAIVLLERGDGKPRQTAEVAMRQLQPVIIRAPEEPDAPVRPGFESPELAAHIGDPSACTKTARRGPDLRYASCDDVSALPWWRGRRRPACWAVRFGRYPYDPS